MKRILIAALLLCVGTPAYAAAVTGTFTATGSSSAITPEDTPGKGSADFNVTLSGTFVGTVIVERSFDNGSTYHPLTALGQSISFTAPASEVFAEPEQNVTVRLRCTAYTSGTVTYRLSN